MKHILKKSLIIIFITIVIIEFVSFLFIKLNLINSNLPSWVTLHAHKEFAYWHPKNITFKNIAAQCWVSDAISYNNYGMRSLDKVELKKKKQRIALLGDSMIENIELSDGYDVGSKIKEKLPEYEILNFSARGTGLGDQIDIYNKLIKKFDIDKIFLFVHYNDLINNSINGNGEIYQRRYDYKDNQIIEIEKDYLWLNNYNSKFNLLKRNYSVYLKNTNSYKAYIHYLGILKRLGHKKPPPKISTNDILSEKNDYEPHFEKNKKIYSFLKEKFISELEPHHELYVILNIFPFNFDTEEKLNVEDIFIKNNVMPFLEITWADQNFIYPVEIAKKYILENKLEYPYFSWTCDKHYSLRGSEFISEVVYNKINN